MVNRVRAARMIDRVVDPKGSPMSAQAAAAFASIQTQVLNIESEVGQLARAIDSTNTRTEAALANINVKLERFGTTPWPIYISGAAFLLSIVVILGTIAYRPIDTQLTALQLQERELEHSMVPRAEHEAEGRYYKALIDGLRREMRRQ